jgi:hypothetical protein
MQDYTHYIFLITKILAVIGSLIYVVFALVVVRQVATMSKNVSDKFNGILIAFSYIHLLAAILLVFLTLVVL